MTEQQLTPSVRQVHLTYYPAKWLPDAADSDADSDLWTQGATLSFLPTRAAARIVTGGVARMADSLKGEYFATASGELRDGQGNLGVNVPHPDDTGVGYSFVAVHESGVRLSGTIGVGLPQGTINLADYVNLNSGPLPSSAESRLAQIESALAGGSGGGLDTEGVQDVVGAMITGAGGTYDDAAGTITLPSGGGGGVVGFADLPAGTTLTVVYASGWPARPTARTDIHVHWVGGPDVRPAGALTGDIHTPDQEA